MPASTSMSVPVKTRKRLRAHHSIHRAITLHPSRRVDAELLVGYGLPVLLRDDRDLPGAAAAELPRSFVEAVTLVRTFDVGAHGRHSHGWHGCHEEVHRD